MAKKKKEAELALASVGGGAVAGGFVSANSPLAKAGAAQLRRLLAQGVLHGQRPDHRRLHHARGCCNAYQQSRAAGFKRYTSCFSQRSSGEHPKGRACDFSAGRRRLQERQRHRRRPARTATTWPRTS